MPKQLTWPQNKPVSAIAITEKKNKSHLYKIINFTNESETKFVRCWW